MYYSVGTGLSRVDGFVATIFCVSGFLSVLHASDWRRVSLSFASAPFVFHFLFLFWEHCIIWGSMSSTIPPSSPSLLYSLISTANRGTVHLGRNNVLRDEVDRAVFWWISELGSRCFLWGSPFRPGLDGSISTSSMRMNLPISIDL